LSLLAYSSSEKVGENLLDIVDSSYHNQLLKRKDILKNKDLKALEIDLKKSDGETVSVEINFKHTSYNNKETILLIVHDISKRKLLDKKITQSIVKTEEKEKERFAKDLHDGLGPILSTCKIYIHTLSKKNSNDPELLQYINRASELLDESLSSIKEISNNLSPHLLRDYGLSNAINSFIDNLRLLHKVEFIVNINLDKRLNEIIEFTIYRILTELINNTFKYAEASEIQILIYCKVDVLYVNYKDNGKGFKLEQSLISTNKYGLLNIQNRIKKLDGKFEYKTSPGNGVDVEIQINNKNYNHD